MNVVQLGRIGIRHIDLPPWYPVHSIDTAAYCAVLATLMWFVGQWFTFSGLTLGVGVSPV